MLKISPGIDLSVRSKLLDCEQFAYLLSGIPLGNLRGILSPKGTMLSLCLQNISLPALSYLIATQSCELCITLKCKHKPLRD